MAKLSERVLRKRVQEWVKAGVLKYNKHRTHTEHPLAPDQRQEALAVKLMLELVESFGLTKKAPPKDYTGHTRDTLDILLTRAELK